MPSDIFPPIFPKEGDSLTYPNITFAKFLNRPNRFVAEVELEGQPVTVHVKNTGRCKELLIHGATVWLTKSDNPNRKTAYDLIGVWKGDRAVNMDSQAPNHLFKEWALAGHFVPGLTVLKGEQKHGDSRFDFYWEAGDRKGFVEVKGVTLEVDGHSYFPDAPTERGIKHLRGLADCLTEGYEAAVCFVIQMEGISAFSPNDVTHPAFGQALREVQAAGVQVLAMECQVEPGTVVITKPVPTKL
ncbi:MAG: DNA/RNA nuclease SfsA [Ruminiclostridium sp.]|nr:DNA/RNA nuclease SfsA [Ruminiclostridium sp.]